MLKSYEKFHAKLRSEGVFETRASDMQRRNYSQINVGNVLFFIRTTIIYLSQNSKNLNITEEDIKDFLERHSVDDGEGNVSYKLNNTTKSLKDYILLTLSHDQMKSLTSGPFLKYLEACQPEIYNNMPFIKEALSS